MCLKCANKAKSFGFGTEENAKLKDSKYRNFSLVGQIDRKNTNNKSKLLVKCFVNSFTKVPPISARNVPKLPEMNRDLKISSLVGQIYRKNRKKETKLLLK